jgi:3-oxoacyl-[acyl-carrier protein] reductase
MSDTGTTVARVALVTGASGGLGQGLVAAFAAHGWRVVAASHREPSWGQSDSIWPVRLDVTEAAAAKRVVQQTVARWGRLDVLVNNAGLTADHLSWLIPDADWDRVLAVNLKGAFLCAQAALPPMLRQRDGHIINLATFAARAGARGQSNYAAAKAGLIGLTQSLAKEVGLRNLRVNAVLPGVLPTPMTAGLPADTLAGFASANTLGRLNSVAEVARFIVFLAGMQNISGQCFQLDSRVARWT